MGPGRSVQRSRFSFHETMHGIELGIRAQ
jgi:hypothetical protein